MTTLRVRLPICASLVTFMIFALPGAAQRVTSDILGVVTDGSGAVVIDTRVTVRRLETGEQHETATGTNGQYRFTGLSAGNYEIRFEKPSFQTGVLTNVELLVNQQAI